jgi:hypothetical protein
MARSRNPRTGVISRVPAEVTANSQRGYLASSPTDAGGQLWREQPVIGSFSSQFSDRRHSNNDGRQAEVAVFERYPPCTNGGFGMADQLIESWPTQRHNVTSASSRDQSL